MTLFQVWAPYAERVELAIEGNRIPMQAAERGWWAVEAPQAGPGTNYAYVLDGGPPLPDPRSPYQPQGVHGTSQVVDHQAFPWTDWGWRQAPLASAVIYELHIGAFTPEGTFESAIEKLDSLVEFGVTHLELMPVAEFPGSLGWGYDGVDLYAPHHAYGGPQGLKRLVNACHAKGLAVILDVVYNHLGPDGNYLGRFGPYFTDRYSTPWGDAINFDGRDSDEVRRFFIDNALMWLRDYHVDGLRLDAVHAIIDTSAVHILEQLAVEVDLLAVQLARPLVLIAESDLNDPRLVRPREAGGYGLDAQWNDDFHHALHAVLTGERNGYYMDFGRLAELAKALEANFVYDSRYSAFRGRRHGRSAAGIDHRRFVGYLQNHDQIGNRARGERSSQLLNSRQLKVAAAVVLTAPYVPMLFMGEEWGAASPFQYFTDHQDPALAEAVSRGRVEEFAAFGWEPEQIPNPQAPQTVQDSRLDWSERGNEPHAGLLDWHTRLIRLRKQLPCLSDFRPGRVRVRYDEGARWMVVERGRVRLACNFAGQGQHVPIFNAASKTRILLASDSRIQFAEEGVYLPETSSAILHLDG